MQTYLLLGIKARIFRRTLRKTQAYMAQKTGMTLPEYKKIEEAQNAPDSEKTWKLVEAGMFFTPYDARTRIPAEVVELLLPRAEKVDE
jgi:transcriptional regulator with XRE-family HTH domain